MENLEKESASRELEWLLSSLDETIIAVQSGLEECMALLDPIGPSSTLPLSSSRSESLKGIISRVGSRITRADMQVKMFGLPYTKGLGACKLTLAPATPDHCLVLEQLVDVKNCVAGSLDLLHYASDKKTTMCSLDGTSVMQKLHALQANILAARTALKGPSTHRLFPYHAIDSKVVAFDPPLPVSVAFNLYISEAALVAEIRILDYQSTPETHRSGFLPTIDMSSPFGFRERFAAAVGFRGDGHHSSSDSGEEKIVEYNGMSVKVRESVKVESQDPSLMAVWAKLGGLEHVLGSATKALELVMMAAGF